MGIGGTAIRRAGGAIILMACALAAAVAFASPPAARAAGSDPILEVSPSSIASVSGTVSATVTLRNPGSNSLEQVRLSWFVNGSGSVKVTAAPTETQGLSVVPGGSVAWVITATPDDSVKDATVWFRVDFSTAPAPASSAVLSAPIPGVVVAPLQLTPVVLSATVSVAGGVGSLSEQTPLTVAVVVTNTSPESVSVLVAPHQDDYFTVSPQASGPRDLRPNDTTAFSFTLTAAGRVQPGERTLLFDVTLQTPNATRILTADQAVTLSILGDAEISSLLGTPAFFLVPGFIVLVVWRLMGTAFWPLTTRTMPGVTDKEFWVVAIGISLAFALGYPTVTMWMGAIHFLVPPGGRDYLVARGTLDLYLVWAFAFVAPVSLYVVGLGTELWWRRNDLSPRDKPLDLLHKLAVLPDAKNVGSAVTVDDHHGVLVYQAPDTDQCWVVPRILVELSAADQATQKTIREELWNGGKLPNLVTALRQAPANGKVTVFYDRDGSLSVPKRIGVDKLKFGGPAQIVEELGVTPAAG
jgi:hypothetical protein